MLKALLQGRSLKHPLHPIFVHLPIGLWVFSVILDGVSFFTNERIASVVSFYCIGGGLLGSLLAFPTGLAEYQDIPLSTLPRRIANIHLLLNSVLFFIYLFSFISRRITLQQTQDIITPLQLTLSLTGMTILMISGYLGGRLTYYYGIGFRHQERSIQNHSDKNNPIKNNKVA